MHNKKFVKIFIISSFFIIISLFIYIKLLKKNETKLNQEEESEIIYNSNLIKDVEYSTKDKDGNEYLIKAEEGEIDFSNSNIIFLKKVNALIKLIDSEEVKIVSNFGKYNSENYDTIFSKNVIINYLDNKITGEYLDFSLERNSMIISKDVNYSNLENILKADVVEINIKTKDTKIFMYDKKKKINIKSKN
tara:strand:- start:3726 stop:4298 length:573 start_codon:yes stop_codon:yes gene_type:complete